MDSYGVLIVDDSAFMRKTIGEMIDSYPNFHVIGKARNGIDALEKIENLRPALILMDIEMPKLNGLEALAQIMMHDPLPVIILTNDAEAAVEATALGAVDFIHKNDLIHVDNETQLKDFYERLKVAASATIVKRKELIVKPAPVIIERDETEKSLVLIGSSTGGPAALQKILSRIPETIGVPILIVQHMPVGFTRHLASRFDTLCNVRVKEAAQYEILEAGTIYIAPAGIQTTIQQDDNSAYVIHQKDRAPVETLYKPSIDVALLSIAPIVQEKLLTIILTGMGDDGLRGCKAVKQHGGTVIAEAPASCVIYGMPKVVFEAGLVDHQVLIDDVFDTMMQVL